MSELIEQQPQQITVAAQAQTASIMSFIERAASDNSVDIDKLERLIQLSERMQAKTAEQAFNAAMAQMQCEIPTVVEGAVNQHTKNTYATLDDINVTLKPIMQRFGFAVTFKVEHQASGISVTGILMHSAGHREQTTLLLPVDIGAGRNAVQAVGSSTTYGKRYVMCALLNITTGDARDDDGQTAIPDPVITDIQARQLQALLPKCSKKAQSAFTKLYPDITLITKPQFDTVLNQLTTSANNNKEPAQ